MPHYGEENARVRVDAATEVRVSETLIVVKDGELGSSGSVAASDIIFYVAGTVEVGTAGAGAGNAKLKANVYAVNGTIRLNIDADVTGALLARDVLVAEKVTLTLDLADALSRAGASPVADAQSVSTNSRSGTSPS